jgi:hypothetical protein
VPPTAYSAADHQRDTAAGIGDGVTLSVFLSARMPLSHSTIDGGVSP